MSFGDILGTAAGIFRRNPGSVLPISLLLVTLQQVLVVAIALLAEEVPTRGDLLSGANQLDLAGGIGALVGLVVGNVVGAVLTGMIVVLVADDLLGQQLGLGAVWDRVQPRLFAIIGVSLLTSLLAALGLVLLVVPGMLLWAAWSLTVPALLLERLGPIRAMRRSWQLAWPDVWRVFGIRAGAGLLGSLILYVIAAPFSVLGFVATDTAGTVTESQASLLLLFLAAVGSILGGVIVRPFVAGVVALLYLDRRMRAEGMDLVLHVQLRQRRQPAAGGAGWQPRADLPQLEPRIGDTVPVGPGAPPPGFPPVVGTR